MTDLLKEGYHVFTDFDGTVTKVDTLVYLLNKFGDPSWQDIEKQLEEGRINENAALNLEIDTLRVCWDEAITSLKDGVEIDPDFGRFINLLNSYSIPYYILSGGFEEIIRELLSNYPVPVSHIRANNTEISGDRWRVIPSRIERIKGLCNHCKSFSVVEAKRQGYKTIYIGDGTTDRCPVSQADIIFAKGSLAEFCKAQHIIFHPFTDFCDVCNILEIMFTSQNNK